MNNTRMEEKYIELDDLMLDPNNPRFVRKFGSAKHFSDDSIEGCQNNVLRLFTRGKGTTELEESDNEESLTIDSGDFFDIEDLWNSMSNIGFVPIDRIVARRLIDSDKYLVIEGNRRIATVKQLLKKDSTETNPNRKLNQRVVESLKAIEALILTTEGMSQEEVDHQVAVILGLRHYGSVLEWSPLPKAYNMWREYMGLAPIMDDFRFENPRANRVASRLSVKPTDVRKACMTYIVYRQLSDTFPGVKPHHYSLIAAAVTRKSLTNSAGYFTIDSFSFKMDEPSLYKMNELCQFDERDNPAHKDTIPEPRDFSYLVRLVRARDSDPIESVKKHAAGLIVEAELANRTAESAADSLKDFINQTAWATALERELDKQEKELNIEDFRPIGMELTALNEVANTFERLRKVLEV